MSNVAVKKHAKLDIIFLKSWPILLYVFTLCRTFCPGLQHRCFIFNYMQNKQISEFFCDKDSSTKPGFIVHKRRCFPSAMTTIVPLPDSFNEEYMKVKSRLTPLNLTSQGFIQANLMSFRRQKKFNFLIEFSNSKSL